MEPETVELPPQITYPPGGLPPEVEVPQPNSDNLPVPEEVAQGRAIKANIGLGTTLDKSVTDFKNDFTSGKEKNVRDQAAATLDLQRQKQKQAQLVAMSQKYGPLSPQQVSQFLDPFAPQNQSTDPDTVIEKQFAKSYIGTLATAPGFLGTENVIDVASREIPKQTSETEDIANDLVLKNQYLLKKLQDRQQMASQQSWFDWSVDQLKGVTQIYPEVKQRGLVDNIYGQLGLGSNKEEQSNALYRKPFDQFKKTVDAIDSHLGKDNPSLAVSFLQNMYGQDTFEKTVDNIFTAMAVPDMALGAKLVKKVLTYNEIRKAAKDMVIAANKDNPPTPASMVAAAGDTQESAVLTVADGVMKAVQGQADPIQTAKNTLLTSWKQMADDFSTNQGTYLSREANTRILDSIPKDGANLLDKITTMNRVERTPRIYTEDVIRAQKDAIREQYKGPNAMVLDVQGPAIEPASNTKWFAVHLGDYDASLFADRATAEGRAESLGLSIVKGELGDKVYLPPTAAKSLESVKTTETGTKFYVDQGIEVQASPKPQPGFIPYNLKTNRFEPALTEESTRVQQQGLGFYLEHWIPLKETGDTMRDLMIKDTRGNVVPETVSMASSSGTKSIINSVMGWVRNSDETMALNESIQRKAVVYSQSNIHKWAADLQRPIEKVANKGAWWKPTAYLGSVTGKQVKAQFERTLDYARQTESWFKTTADLQDFYLRNFSRDPSVLETQAYFNYVKLIEGDRMLGEIAEFRNRARVGTEQHRIRLVGPDGKPIYSDLFDGVTIPRLPANTDQILIAGDSPGKDRVVEANRFSSKVRKEISARIERGESKLVEVYDIDHHPLSGFSDAAKGQRIRYVLADTIESNPISFNHVNKKEGGHFDWDYDHFIKQADMRGQASGKHIYVGDKTVMPIGNKALGNNVAKIWNEAQDLIKQDRWEDVRPLAAKLGINYEDFIGWYKPGRDAKGRPRGPSLNPHEPMYVVPRGKNILSLDSSLESRYLTKNRNTGQTINQFVDGSRTGYANNFKVAYNTERHTDFNFRTIGDVGTKENPVYVYQPAKLVDPLPTMNRALNRAINSAFMDDYKLYAIEHWLREAETHLDVTGGVDAVRSSPFWHYNNPKYKSSTPLNVKWNLEQQRYKIDTFVGVPSKFDAWVHTYTEHLANTAYDNFGPEENRTFFQKAQTITPIWLLHRVKNPVDFIRGVTFNFKLGLFNPAQFLVQAQTHALIWSLEPTHGTVGTFAMLLHGWSKVNRNPAILRSLDNYYTKLNMFGSKARPGEFLEAQSELEKTGFEHVAGEYGNVAKAYLPTANFLQGDITKGLKIGQTPFRLGEQSTRVTAWYTAFRKFRAENPNVPIGNIERSKILNQADLLTVNMSRASSSLLNHGVFSLSTQFLSYQIKLAELFWSKRIGETPAQRAMARARMITGFSLLYGFPNAIGVTGAPFSDNIREHLIDDIGYIPGEKWHSTMINEGYPAWALAMITGKGDIQSGNHDNVGDRFGSQGWQNVKQGLRSDVPWYFALGGAGITTMSNFITAAIDPFYQGVLSWARGDTGDQRFTIKGADLVEPFKEISTVNSATKFWATLNSGKWISKNEGYITDVSPLRGAFLAATGMNPQEQDDMFIKNQVVKGEEEAQKKALKEFGKDWERMIQAFQNNDPEQGNAYLNNAMARFAVVGYPYEEVLKAMATSSKGWESAINSSDFSYWTRGNRNNQQQRLDTYLRQQQINEKQK